MKVPKTVLQEAKEEHQRWAMACQKASPTRNLLMLASSHLRLDHKKLDANPFLLNCQNGSVDLLTGILRPHDPEDFITKTVNSEYHADANCPRWMAFLEEIFDGNQETINYLHRALGYSVTGDVSEHSLFLCYGTGANGKSTLTTLMSLLLGGYAATLAPGLLMSRKHDAHPTELANLQGARFTSTSEVKTDAKWDEERIKMLTGGDPIKARRMREDYWEFMPTHKIWIGVNHRPQTVDNTYGFWRRVKMIPFNVTITPEKQDPHLLEVLISEMPGILAWLVRGAILWKEQGLGSATAVDQATESYRNPQNDMEAFLTQCCVIDPELRVQAKDLYQRYIGWCGEIKGKPLGQVQFGQRMKGLGWETTKSSALYYKGFGIAEFSKGRGGLSVYL